MEIKELVSALFPRKNKETENYINKAYLEEEVQKEIDILKKIKSENQFGIPRDSPDLPQWEMIERKYNEKYCPCTFFPKYFSRFQKTKYMFLRFEIDNLLGNGTTKIII